MSEPLKRHSERIRYIRHSFIAVARGAKSLKSLEDGRAHIWSDLEEICDEKVRREAQALFRNTMSTAETIERSSPESVSRIVIDGMRELIEYLEANDIGDSVD